MNKVTKLYQDLTDSIHELGWKIGEISSKECDGEAIPDIKQIGISLKYKNTLYGCSILAHEFGHALDFEAGKYPRFFGIKLPTYQFNFNYKRKFIKEAFLAERSAWQFAKEVLENRNFNLSKKWYTDKNLFENEILPTSIHKYLKRFEIILQKYEKTKTLNYG